MQGKSSSPEQVDRAVMSLLLDVRFDIWAVVEVEREMGSDPIQVRDSLGRLRGAGLVHELDFGGFVMATRAAREADRLDRS